MFPLKISIEGDYWDSYIYSGRLYLFGANAKVTTVNWDHLISEWPIFQKYKLAQICAFLRSDFLYGSESQLLFHDPDIRQIITQKFEHLANEKLEITYDKLIPYIISDQDHPFGFPHSDIEIYGQVLYGTSRDGLFAAGCNKKTKFGISTKVKKKWDAPITGISASYGSLALASGAEGLYEVPTYDFGGLETQPKNVSKTNCTDCSWTYHSIFGSSIESGFLASFNRNNSIYADTENVRVLERVIQAEEIFGTKGYSWGVKDKLCQANNRSIKVVKYNPYRDQDLTELGVVNFDDWKGEIISASTASFGVIVELENAMVIFPSIGPTITLPGEPVNWRVFQRSKHYENQLHIISDESLDIYSFNHDYLVNQEHKFFGTEMNIKGSPKNNSLIDLLMQ